MLCDGLAEQYYAAQRERTRRLRNFRHRNGQRRAALDRWNAHKDTQEATIQAILNMPDPELDALIHALDGSFDTYED